ncbi:MAG: hypothetical protein LT070_01970 [Solirubrobacteraceae bacterium]|nr:hypothetical protein [Solirubrobacteraceae bacterium]
MGDEPASYDFVYVETDIPPGMTIREWRAQRSAERRRRALAPLIALASARTTGRSHAANMRDTVRRSPARARYPWPRIRSFRRSAG